jgi:hypothetical protein
MGVHSEAEDRGISILLLSLASEALSRRQMRDSGLPPYQPCDFGQVA